MSLFNEPITLRKLWSGPVLLDRRPKMVLTCVSRLVLALGLTVFSLFVLSMLAFETFLLFHDPVMALSCWAIVGAVAYLLRFYEKRKQLPPDDFNEGLGMGAVLKPPPLLRVGAREEGVG